MSCFPANISRCSSEGIPSISYSYNSNCKIDQLTWMKRRTSSTVLVLSTSSEMVFPVNVLTKTCMVAQMNDFQANLVGNPFAKGKINSSVDATRTENNTDPVTRT